MRQLFNVSNVISQGRSLHMLALLLRYCYRNDAHRLLEVMRRSYHILTEIKMGADHENIMRRRHMAIWVADYSK